MKGRATLMDAAWDRSTYSLIMPLSLCCSHGLVDILSSVFSSPWMGGVVDFGEVLEVEVGVDLRGGDIGVA